MSGMQHEAEDDGALVRAFELRHPALALAWRLVKRRPISGAITAIGFLVVSTIVIEGFGAGDKLFQRWAETNWYAPFEAHTRMDAVRKSIATEDALKLHLGDYQKAVRPLPFYAVDGGTSPPDRIMSLADIRDDIDPFVVARAPQMLRPGRTFMAIYRANGDIAEADAYVLVWDGTVWGLVPERDYKAASLAMDDEAAR